MGLACYWSALDEVGVAHLDAGLAAVQGKGEDPAIAAQLHMLKGSCFQSLGRGEDGRREILAALRIAEQVGDAAGLLRDPAAVNYFNGPWEAKGDSVGELVDYLIQKGLRFAPAGEGDEPAYTQPVMTRRSRTTRRCARSPHDRRDGRLEVLRRT
jgi:hypothetical protein